MAGLSQLLMAPVKIPSERRSVQDQVRDPVGRSARSGCTRRPGRRRRRACTGTDRAPGSWCRSTAGWRRRCRWHRSRPSCWQKSFMPMTELDTVKLMLPAVELVELALPLGDGDAGEARTRRGELRAEAAPAPTGPSDRPEHARQRCQRQMATTAQMQSGARSSSEPPVHVVGRARVRRGRRTSSRSRRIRPPGPGWPSSARKKAQLWETRCACCMLWVTMTTVTSSAMSRMVSSIRLVDVGSSAEHGSSMRSTRGRTARARAMHSRCCWPPESEPPSSLEAVLDLVPQAGLREHLLDELTSRARRVSLVRENFSPDRTFSSMVMAGKRVRLLEDHADVPAGCRWRAGRRRRCRRRPARPGRPAGRPGTSSCMRLRMRRKVDLPQPDGPISAVTVSAPWSARRSRGPAVR